MRFKSMLLTTTLLLSLCFHPASGEGLAGRFECGFDIDGTLRLWDTESRNPKTDLRTFDLQIPNPTIRLGWWLSPRVQLQQACEWRVAYINEDQVASVYRFEVSELIAFTVSPTSPFVRAGMELVQGRTFVLAAGYRRQVGNDRLLRVEMGTRRGENDRGGLVRGWDVFLRVGLSAVL